MKKVHRRDVLRLAPAAALASVFGGLAQLACTYTSVIHEDPKPRAPGATDDTKDDELVEGQSTPVEVPNQVSLPKADWESRSKDLDAQQAKLFGAVFSQAAPGVFAGKEKSHVPKATVATENGLKRVIVTVEHVMGANGLPTADAGPKPDAAAPPPPPVDAGAPDAADAAPPPATDASAAPPVHYITTIYLKATVNGQEMVVGLWEFKPTDPAPPSVKFTLPAGATNVIAYEWCSLHGLWKTDPIPV